LANGNGNGDRLAMRLIVGGIVTLAVGFLGGVGLTAITRPFENSERIAKLEEFKDAQIKSMDEMNRKLDYLVQSEAYDRGLRKYQPMPPSGLK